MGVATIPVFKRQTATPPPDGTHDRQRLVVVGSGPVGLAMALDLGLRGHRVVIVSAHDFIPHGSKAICFSKQSLDLFDRLGIGERVLAKGVVWNVGKVFWGASNDPVYEFDMLPVKGQKNPGFVNIQQYYVEDYLVDAIAACDNVEIRWGHRVADVTPGDDGCRLRVETAAGAYELAADYVLACDGSRSTVRQALGLDFAGRVFEDNFLIADVRFRQQRPSERWFWFDPPFNPGRTALLHKQPDDVWRLDFQLGADIDREAAVEPAAVTPLVRGMLGDDVEFDYEWLSVYTFQCRRMQRFVHGRVVFVGDSAHLVSPFGARGCNGGLADVDNLGWKLDRILRGAAAAELLASYDQERIAGSDENILNSSRATDFMASR
ncbi:MAG: FAD-dependent monooxygenase [Pseudomonadota bacterium]